MSGVAMLQLKQDLTKLSPREREEISVFLLRLKQQTVGWKKEMTRLMTEMDSGKKFRLNGKPAQR